MPVSAFELFRLGIGPSSSHTVGPMRLALRFVRELQQAHSAAPHRWHDASIQAHLYGSLALTGRGHASDTAIAYGLLGHEPETIDLSQAKADLLALRSHGRLILPNGMSCRFDPARDIVFHPDQSLPSHPNGMVLEALDVQGHVIDSMTAYSIGGGFVKTQAELLNPQPQGDSAWPHPFESARDLLRLCRERACSIADLMRANEMSLRPREQVNERLDAIWQAMQACIQSGLVADGHLPGPLKVPRRAAQMRLQAEKRSGSDPMDALDWLNAYAVAVNEENAAGAKVVTAPTNGAAGVLPAVLQYHQRFVPGAHPDQARDFLLTAAAIGSLYKENASISGAEVGCQGEVGVAASMAAAGLTAVMGGTPAQVENAAEIAMEHHLGMTCDPIGGMVQIPCIERNAMGAVKAVNAARMALYGDGQHQVSLDQVIHTMRVTGADMSHKYKETSLGGLAVSFVSC